MPQNMEAKALGTPRCRQPAKNETQGIGAKRARQMLAILQPTSSRTLTSAVIARLTLRPQLTQDEQCRAGSAAAPQLHEQSFNDTENMPSNPPLRRPSQHELYPTLRRWPGTNELSGRLGDRQSASNAADHKAAALAVPLPHTPRTPYHAGGMQPPAQQRFTEQTTRMAALPAPAHTAGAMAAPGRRGSSALTAACSSPAPAASCARWKCAAARRTATAYASAPALQRADS